MKIILTDFKTCLLTVNLITGGNILIGMTMTFAFRSHSRIGRVKSGVKLKSCPACNEPRIECRNPVRMPV